jgi:uridine kinase
MLQARQCCRAVNRAAVRSRKSIGVRAPGMIDRSRWIGGSGVLVTISGGAGAGKTTLAAALAGPRTDVAVLHLDDYCGEAPDAGDPGSVDFARLDADVAGALTRNAVVVAEGMFAFRVGVAATPGARFDVFADLPADLRLARKIHRQCVEGGAPLDLLLSSYVAHRRAAHERHVEPARQIADLVVSTEAPAEQLADQIWRAITRGGGASAAGRRGRARSRR